MKTSSLTSFRYLALALILSIFCVFSAQAQIVLVDPTTRNGSFESGTSGWITADGNALTTSTVNPPGPTQGLEYAVMALTAPNTAPGSDGSRYDLRNIGFDINDGTDFTISFDIQTAAVNGFDLLSLQAVFDGPSVGPQVVVNTPNISSFTGSYTTLTYEYDATTFANPASEYNTVDLRFIPLAIGTTMGDTYTAYLDNVVFSQVPEPSSLGLLGLAGLCAVGYRSRKGRRS